VSHDTENEWRWRIRCSSHCYTGHRRWAVKQDLLVRGLLPASGLAGWIRINIRAQSIWAGSWSTAISISATVVKEVYSGVRTMMPRI